VDARLGFQPRSGGADEIWLQEAHHGNPQVVGNPKQRGNTRLAAPLEKVPHSFGIGLCRLCKRSLITHGIVIGEIAEILCECTLQ
jgi:hypothetical protein